MDRKSRFDWLLIFLVTAAVSVSVFTLYSQEAIIEDGENKWIKQLIYFIIGVVLALILRRIHYPVFGDISVIFYGITLLFLVLTLIPFIGSEIKGARSWIRIGPFGFQSSEFAKLATIILLARYLELKEKEMDKIPTLLLAFSIIMVPMGLIVVQPDFGGSFTFAPIAMAMLFVAGADILHIMSILIFFSTIITIPLFIEFKKITMVEPLIAHISSMNHNEILPAVRILRSYIWDFSEYGKIPGEIKGEDLQYLENVVKSDILMNQLTEAIYTVRYEHGGILLSLADNDILIFSVAIILSLAALSLFVIRFTRGIAFQYLRKYYIPMGVIGLSLLAAGTIHLTIPFKYHQVVRITAFLNPDEFPRDLAYQIRASKAAIGSGEFAGKGLMSGDMTLGDRPLVPEATTDFIFTAWAERTGFLGSVFLLFVLMGIPLRALQVSLETKDRFAALLGSGIAFMYFFHFSLNIGIAIGLLPVTGLPLSFLSYGGSHMIITMMGVGILLSIYRKRFVN